MKAPKPRVLSVAMAELLAGERLGPKEVPLRLAVSVVKGRVVMQMPALVQTINLAPDQAEALAQALIKHAAEARQETAA